MLKSFLFWGNGDWAQGNHLSCARKSSGASTDWAQSRQDWQCFALVERICATIFLDKDKLFASLELSRRNKGFLPYFLC